MRLRLILAALHAWVAWRIGPSLGPLGATLFVLLLVASVIAMPYGLRARRRRGSESPDLLAWVALVAMGLFSSLFVLTLVRDVGLLVLAAFDALAPARIGFAAAERASAIAVPVAAAVITLWGFANARRTARIARVNVPVLNLPAELEGFSIVQISDVHVGPTIRRPFVEAIVAAVNDLDADMVAITGDLVDGPVSDLAAHVAPLAGLRSRDGTFFVTGNHEYYSGAAGWIRELRRLGIRVLLNEHVVLRRGAAAIVVAGVTDFSAAHFDRSQASDPKAAIAGSPPGVALRVLLAHQPRSAAAAEAAGFDLQLSGHTHGGQFFPWNFFVRLQQPFTAGLNRWRRMWVYTSRGTGYWGPPKRFGAPSEITLLRLVRARVPAAQRSAVPPRVADGAAGL
ncbi:MAG TPA: metallophosphoesterase [Caldimonas sp.]|nr:metallophosphoesterase [Caldimonas sp.]HEX2542172.1 metallophosphoesterase [Caldimonas sp.]